MNNDIILNGPDDDRIKNLGAQDTGPVLGAWYWCRFDRRDADEGEGKKQYSWEQFQYVRETDKGPEVLVCCMDIGSNYVEVRTPGQGQRDFYQTAGWRIHIKDFWTTLTPEPNAQAVIQARMHQCQQASVLLLEEINSVTQRLGMNQQQRLGGSAAPSQNALVVMSSTPDITGYKSALVEAKDKQLPELFKQLKESHLTLAVWMTAPAMSMLAQVGDLQDYVEEINGRIFSISLYAGLTEDAVQVQDGEPAEVTERLHVMQRMLFMDEESLLDYQHGGMDFNSIQDFDRFISKPVNRDRILPFPRTLVAMRVRRHSKDYGRASTPTQAFINMQMNDANKSTFLYVRNGERIFRISCEMDFDELIFPTRDQMNPLEPKMMHRDTRDYTFISVPDYEQCCERLKQMQQQRRELRKARAKFRLRWIEEHPEATKEEKADSWTGKWNHATLKDGTKCPPEPDSGYSDFRPEHWELFSPDSVYYDDAMEQLDKQMREYNRVALIIQGLFDRSQVLHPHLPVKTWTADGFDRAIKLMYDGSDVLHYGEAPDFDEYRRKCNASIKLGSNCIGQYDYWLRKMAEKENERRKNNWRERDRERLERYKPPFNPGPHDPGKVEVFNSKQGCTFRWERERQSTGGKSSWRVDAVLTDKITVPVDELFNLDAYELGDFKQFFQDPRSRAQYMGWAPFLLRAEEWKASQLGLPKGAGRRVDSEKEAERKAAIADGWIIHYDNDGNETGRSKGGFSIQLAEERRRENASNLKVRSL